MASTVEIILQAKDLASSAFKQVSSAVDGFNSDMENGANASKAMGMAIGILTSGLYVAKQAFEFSREGAQLERLAASGSEMARQFGGNMDEIIMKVREASNNTVSDMDIIASANKAMMLGLGADADELAELMEVAAFRGRAMGVSTTQAFDDIVRGIGRASPMILDNLGIVISADETHRDYAESIGKTKDELTKAEKTQALMNKVLEDGNRMLEEAGGLQDDSLSSIERMDASWKNFTDNRKRESADFAVSFADSAAAALDGWDQLFQAMNNVGEIERIAKEMAEKSGGHWKQYQEDAMLVWQTTKAEMDSAADGMKEFGAASQDAALDAEAVAEAMKQVSEANKVQLSTIETLQGRYETFQANYEKITSDTNLSDDERIAKIKELEAEYELTTRKIVLGLLEQKLAQDGLTDAELGFLLEKGQAWGIYSDTVVTEAQAAISEANALADSINGLPTSKSIDINIQTNYSGATQAALQAYTAGEKGYIPARGARAEGGYVAAGSSYLVGERGAEMFVPSGNGNIVPNNQLGGGSVNITLVYSPAVSTASMSEVESVLAPIINKAVRSGYRGGQLG